MIAINDILSQLLHKTPHNDVQNWKLYLVTNWAQIVGPLASRICIEKIEHDTIIIGVCDSTWLQELYLLSEVLLQKINQSLQTPHLKKIKFKHASYKTTIKKIYQKSPVIATKKQQPLTHAERGALHAIADQELSNVLYQFLVRCQQTQTH